jgi:hypothetical protein
MEKDHLEEARSLLSFLLHLNRQAGDDAHRRAREREMLKIVAELESLQAKLDGLLNILPCTAENPNESAYERGRFDGVMEFAASLRALRPSFVPNPSSTNVL